MNKKSKQKVKDEQYKNRLDLNFGKQYYLFKYIPCTNLYIIIGEDEEEETNDKLGKHTA